MNHILEEKLMEEFCRPVPLPVEVKLVAKEVKLVVKEVKLVAKEGAKDVNKKTVLPVTNLRELKNTK